MQFIIALSFFFSLYNILAGHILSGQIRFCVLILIFINHFIGSDTDRSSCSFDAPLLVTPKRFHMIDATQGNSCNAGNSSNKQADKQM